MRLNSKQKADLRNLLLNCRYFRNPDGRHQVLLEMQKDYPEIVFRTTTDPAIEVAGVIEDCLAYGGAECLEDLLTILEGYEGAHSETMMEVWATWRAFGRPELPEQLQLDEERRPAPKVENIPYTGPGSPPGTVPAPEPPALPLHIDPDDPPVAAIRRLLTSAFTVKDLQAFCYDRSQFRPVLRRVGPNAGVDGLADEVIIYCQVRLLWDELLAEVQAENPAWYTEFLTWL